MAHVTKRAGTGLLALSFVWFCSLTSGAPKPAAVTVAEDQSAYTLSNGIVSARIDKRSGDLLSMKYKGMEMLATIVGSDGLPDTAIDKPGANMRGGGKRYTDHQYGFWSHDTEGPNTTAKITIDPKSNDGERAEVSIKGISGGKPMGAGPGGSFISDVEIRYTLDRDRPGLYTYSIFEHQPDYPASSLGEARFCAKLADLFDWMSVAANWSRPYPKAQPGEHEDKYDFTTNQFENPAFGWSSTSKNVGFWFLNPSVEYLSGGPTKVEFLGHRDTNEVQAPTVLNYWRSSHYGGAVVDVTHGEHWTKVIGPFLLYVNSGRTPADMFSDAQAEARKESQKWPYGWVAGVDYPHRDQRAAVSGQLILKDPAAKGEKMTRLRVGLAAPAYNIQPISRTGAPVAPRLIDWQTDAAHYEFWAFADNTGRFHLPAVRPGKYTLHAFADGVLGEFIKTDVTVSAGKPLDLGSLDWTPVRHGRQVWEIGYPNRTGSEFAKGDDYAHDGMFLLYAKMFPSDVNYVVGKSDFHKDWFFEQAPHNENPDAKPAGYNMGTPSGRATPWTISFDLAQAPSGKAHLRLALASTSTRQIDVIANGQPVGTVDHLFSDGAIARNGILGVWCEKEVVFDASVLKAGTNVLKLVVPAGSLTAGVIYDYLRLEIEEGAEMIRPALFRSLGALACLAAAFGADGPANPALPSIFIAGDSTAADGDPNAVGWGKLFPRYFDLSKMNVVNAARGGRSSRTFVAEGLWDSMLANVRKGDYVLIQFGQNDGAERNGERIARGSLPGLGEETEEIFNRVTHQQETIHTFGWYMRKMIHETRDKAAMPILCSLTVRDFWKDGRVERGSGQYSQWTRQLAESEGVAFIDLTNLVADRYEQLGQAAVKPLFPRDPVHTSEQGADLNASYLVAGIKALRENGIIRMFSAAGREAPIAAPVAILMPRLKRPPGSQRDDFLRWLNLPYPADPALPSLFLAGDSTVRNGRGDGIDGLGQWGWGDPLAAWFDTSKINVVNRAVGGTGVRSFMAQGYWDQIVAMLKPGDVVIIQFGHNDNGPAAPLKGTGEETEDRAGQPMHTWGWYLRKYIADARAKGAVPVVCTLIPRNIWENGKIARPSGSHADWAREVAKAQNVPLLDLFDRIADRYDPMGEPAVTALFADKRVHTSKEGAELNASIVVAALRALKEDPAGPFLRPEPAAIW